MIGKGENTRRVILCFFRVANRCSNISVDFDWSAFPILYISGFIQELVSAVICVAAIVILPGLLFLLFALVLCVWRLWVVSVRL